jgi:hypothetical protein
MNTAKKAQHTALEAELLKALYACLKCLKMDSDSEEDYMLEIKQAEKAIAKVKGV